KLKEQVLVTALLQASYLRKKELVALDSGKRTTVGSGGFFVYRKGDYDWNERISRRSCNIYFLSSLSSILPLKLP
ncbi:hypothetical protein O6058_00575, partial [Salmonella enterica subsp. enterica]